MILTFTANPSLDLLFEAGELLWDDANRVEAPRRRPGGQGINVVRAVRELGGEAVAIAPLGGPTGAELEELLRVEGSPLERVEIPGETRVFVGVRERSTGRSLLLNPRGPVLPPECAGIMLETLRGVVRARRPAWLACCGSIPRGLPAFLYAEIGELASESGVRFVPDCDGEPLRLAVERGCDLLVPNRHEAARLLGSRVEDVEDAAVAAGRLRELGASRAAVTLGERGAVLATATGVWHARGPQLSGGSAVGAGDAFLAALLLGLDEGEAEEALRTAVAAGTAVLLSQGSALISGRNVRAIARDVAVRRLG